MFYQKFDSYGSSRMMRTVTFIALVCALTVAGKTIHGPLPDDHDHYDGLEATAVPTAAAPLGNSSRFRYVYREWGSCIGCVKSREATCWDQVLSAPLDGTDECRAAGLRARIDKQCCKPAAASAAGVDGIRKFLVLGKISLVVMVLAWTAAVCAAIVRRVRKIGEVAYSRVEWDCSEPHSQSMELAGVPSYRRRSRACVI